MEVKNTELADGHGVMTGYAAHIRGEGEKGIILVTVMMLIPVILFYLLFLMHAMGAGDIKLFMALSCMTDYSIVLHTIIFPYVWQQYTDCSG